MSTFLYQQWKDLVVSVLSPLDFQNTKGLKNVFDKIVSKYQNPERFYHTLTHIKDLLELACEYEKQIADYDTFRFAIWFHDLIYKPQNLDNEAKSVLKAIKILSRIPLPRPQIEQIAYYIRCTQNHLEVESSNFDVLLFVDFDLSIWGANRNIYIEYAKNIQKEYNFVPIMTYNQKRKEFLEKMLAAPTIYKTPEAQNRFETNARENLRYEIEFCLQG